jgi:hypothetical protein
MERLRGFADALTIDQLAALSDAEMIRRRSDTTNVRWLALVSTAAFLVSIGQFLAAVFSSHPEAHLLPVAIAHFLFAITSAAFFGELALAQRRRGSWNPRLPVHLISRNLTPWVIAYLIVEFALLTMFRHRNSDGWLAWGMVFPWLLIMVRCDLSRRIALHVSLLGVVVVNALILGIRDPDATPEYTAIVVMNAIAFILGAAATRRMRSQTLDEWVERRTQAREQLRMRDELQYAREVQLSMLPECPPSLSWVDLCGVSIPATEVGGDYYDYFVDRDAVSIVCGDVAGHGMASAIVLASLRSGFTLLRDFLDDPAPVLKRLSDLVAQTSRRRMLATVAVVRLDVRTGHAIIASAGHPPVIVRRGDSVEAVELYAPPLGVKLKFDVPSREMGFGSGDVFVMHSDGVYEMRNEADESYGLDRLLTLVAALPDLDATGIRDAIVDDIESFRGSVPQQDDVTIVVARVR